jgi:hypothetical protein
MRPAIGIGGTPSVVPLGAGICVNSGIPPTVTVFDAQTCGGATTDVHGFELGDGGTVQMIGEPITSVSRSAGEPPIVTVNCFGMTFTLPPWVHWMTALEFSAGNGIGTSIVAGWPRHNPTRSGHSPNG